MTVRAPGMSPESGVPFAAYIHPANPKSGPYEGPPRPRRVPRPLGTQCLRSFAPMMQ